MTSQGGRPVRWFRPSASRRSPVRRAWAWAAFALSACGAPAQAERDVSAFSGGTGSTFAGGAAGQGEAGQPIIGGSGGGAAGGGATTPGCDKVDFLFVVDNSVSMANEQAALIGSFPSFMSTLRATSDYHIMVVDTDAVTRCTAQNCKTGAMEARDLCVKPASGHACDVAAFTPCDTTLGAGVVHPAGGGATNRLCAVQGGRRYLTQDEPDLDQSFSCVAQVGLAGHPSERPMDALVAALSPELNAPGGCNAGYLRRDAILVVTFVSDDLNHEDAGTPADWYAALVAAKEGNAGAVAVLGLTPHFPACGRQGGAHWSEFVKLWGERGLEAPVCAESYGDFFSEAVRIIDETCDDFTPPS